MRGKEYLNNYVIIALICLIVFNIGVTIINFVNIQLEDEKEAKEVFNPSSPLNNMEDEFYLMVLGRTSSIINLYRNQHLGKKSFLGNLNVKEFVVNRLNSLFKGQFPAIINVNAKGLNPLDENNIEEYDEDPDMLEDIIIIDKVEEYEDLVIIRDSEGKVALENLPKPLNVKPLTVDKSKPYILIYHTHGTESYSSLENNTHHSTDRRQNVTTIGEILANTLEGRGHRVEHVTKYHDIPSYNQSYAQSLKTIQEKLAQNSNLKVLLDVHRDGYDHNDPNVKKNLKSLLEKTKVEIDGKQVATFFFVVGPDSPNKDAVLSFAKYVKAISDIMYPNLCKGIVIKPVGKYNQYLSDYSALIEIGSNLNTLEEAKETAKLVGEILSAVLDNIIN
jgi:stage II sporulation protein P